MIFCWSMEKVNEQDSKGLFNVPFNNAKNPLLCDEDNLRACSELLQNVEMTVGDYKECKSFIDDKGVPAKAVGLCRVPLTLHSFASLRNGYAALTIPNAKNML